MNHDNTAINWPPCVKSFTPVQTNINREDLPRILKKAYMEKNIPEHEWIIPIRPVSELGTCTTDLFKECPNLPEHYLDMDDRYRAKMGKYYWYDMEVKDGAGAFYPLRLVYNTGDADCNDGFWGAYWDLTTGELVAHIKSTGDCETTIEIVSRSFLTRYKEYKKWIPESFDENYMIFSPFVYAKNLEIEIVLGMGIRLSFIFRQRNDKAFYREYGYPNVVT
ncbi:MAG: hypothetical protein JXB88_07670 [Spirochaetales bacterium]|nr:hypothetical protein [Spirochaetales bacterium]